MATSQRITACFIPRILHYPPTTVATVDNNSSLCASLWSGGSYATSDSGPAIAGLVGQLIESAKNPFTSLLAAIVSVAFTVTGALGAFGSFKTRLTQYGK